MQITLFSIVFATVGLFSVASAQTSYPFPIRAWRDTRYTPGALQVNHYVEIDSNGDAVINTAGGYSGFQSYLSTPKEGTLQTIDDQLQAYLFPISTDPNTKQYQLKYSSGLPTIPGVLFSNFTEVVTFCGGNCGGYTLNYDDGEESVGNWYIIKEGNSGDNVWKVRWASSSSSLGYPGGSLSIYLWKH